MLRCNSSYTLWLRTAPNCSRFPSCSPFSTQNGSFGRRIQGPCNRGKEFSKRLTFLLMFYRTTQSSINSPGWKEKMNRKRFSSRNLRHAMRIILFQVLQDTRKDVLFCHSRSKDQTTKGKRLARIFLELFKNPFTINISRPPHYSASLQ